MKENWSSSTLAEVCEIKPPKGEVKRTLTDSDSVSFVPMDQLGICAKAIDVNGTKPLGVVYKSYTYFAENDVLLAKITPCFENGKLGIARGLENGVGFGSSEFIVLRCGETIDPDYLFYFLSRDCFRDAGAKVMAGAVGHKRIPKDFIERHEVPLPPLSEQKRIVAILDEAFAGIDRVTANTEKNITNARELFESQLNAVFSQEGEDWNIHSLAEIAENLDNKRIPITKSKRKAGNVPYYGASGVVDYVEGYLFDEELLLVSEDGANLLARTYPIAFSIRGKSWVNNHAHVLRFRELPTKNFVEFYLNSISLEPWVSGMAQPKLNQKALNSIPIPVPPFTSQVRIVETMQQLQGAKAILADIYRRKFDALSILKQSILQKAFAGQLTAKPDRLLAEAGA